MPEEDPLKIFDGFRFARFEFVLEPLEDICLPAYKGSALRGGFGWTFKRVICSERNKDCSSCPRAEDCIYIYIFETRLPKNSKVLKNLKDIPRPFVIRPPLEDKGVYKKGEELSFEMVLIGKAIEYFPYFVFTFEELGRRGLGKGRGRYILKAVNQQEELGEKRGIFDGRQGRFKDSPVVSTWSDCIKRFDRFEGDRLSLNFLTPTRISYESRLSRNLEFHILLRNLLRRISNLSYFHNEKEIILDYKGLIEDSKTIGILEDRTEFRDWERYSNRQGQRIKMGGLIGEITYSGELQKFLPLLILGEAIHIGENTTFGMGRYQICYISLSG